MLDNATIISNVKAALGITAVDFNEEIICKINAVKELIDLPEDIVNTSLGQQLIIIGVTDIWNLSAGEIKFSPAYDILWNKLYNKSLNSGDADESG